MNYICHLQMKTMLSVKAKKCECTLLITEHFCLHKVKDYNAINVKLAIQYSRPSIEYPPSLYETSIQFALIRKKDCLNNNIPNCFYCINYPNKAYKNIILVLSV